MKILRCILLVSCYLVLIVNSVFSSTQPIEMQILALKGNSLASNKGSMHGVIKDTEYQIVRRSGSNEEILGTAKVYITKSDKSGLKILSLRKGKTVIKGDWLIELTETEENILTTLEDSNSPDQYKQKAEDLEKELQENKVKDSHQSGLITGIAICCGIVLILNLGAAAGSN